jgi:hypothetical protein
VAGSAEPEPYVAPDDPNTGERTEPFRGPFEPPAGQPKLSDFVPSSPSSGGPGAPDAPGQPGTPGEPDAAAETQLRERLGAAAPVPSMAPIPPMTLASPGDGASLSVPAPGAPDDRGASEEKLERIRDLYLTVEAIGDDNVGKHFDELMSRQRELISDYFKETGIGKGPRGTPQTDQPS